jgi:hypothetical protein
MQTNINKLYKNIAKRQNPSTFKKAVISSVNKGSGTANAYFIENPQNTINNIPFSSAVDIANVVPGTKCRVDIFDETNPTDMVIAYTYGGSAGATSFAIRTGSSNGISTGGTTIPHGLGAVPRITIITLEATPSYNQTFAVSGGSGGSVTVTNLSDLVYEYQPADATNIYLKATHSTIAINWAVMGY